MDLLESCHQKINLFLGIPASCRAYHKLNIEPSFVSVPHSRHTFLIYLIHKILELEDDPIVYGGFDAVKVAFGVVIFNVKDEWTFDQEQKSE